MLEDHQFYNIEGHPDIFVLKALSLTKTTNWKHTSVFHAAEKTFLNRITV